MKKLTRREILKAAGNFLAALGTGAILGPVVGFFYPKNLERVPSEPVPAGPVEELPPGKSKTIRFGQYPAIVINTPEGHKAYLAACTHFACITKWDEQLGQLVCPCHEGFFDSLDGGVISGPPPGPLQALKLEIIDGTIFVGGQQ